MNELNAPIIQPRRTSRCPSSGIARCRRCAVLPGRAGGLPADLLPRGRPGDFEPRGDRQGPARGTAVREQQRAELGLPARPGAIKLVGGPTLYADWLPLEAAGLEPNGTVKPIDELSFTSPRARVGEIGPASLRHGAGDRGIDQTPGDSTGQRARLPHLPREDGRRPERQRRRPQRRRLRER